MSIGSWYLVFCIATVFALTGLFCFGDNIAIRGFEELGDFVAACLLIAMLTLPAAAIGYLLRLKLDIELLEWWPLPLIILTVLTATLFLLDPFGWAHAYFPKAGYLLLHILGVYLLACIFVVIAGLVSNQPMLIKRCCMAVLISLPALVLTIFGGDAIDIIVQRLNIKLSFDADVTATIQFLIGAFFFLIATISSLIAFVTIMFRKSPYDRY